MKDKVNKIVKAYQDDNEVLEFLDETLNAFAEYVRVVNEMENCISILRFRLEPEQYRQTLENLDRNRRITHNSVIAGVKMINRMCKAKELPLFFEGDITDRIEVAEFAMKFVAIVFKERKK